MKKTAKSSAVASAIREQPNPSSIPHSGPLLRKCTSRRPDLFPDSETFAGEWYLDSIVTKQSARGKGVAHQLLQALPTLATAAGETVIGLNCEKDNLQAKKLYEKVGFRTVSERILSGHVYDHMQWDFTGTSLYK